MYVHPFEVVFSFSFSAKLTTNTLSGKLIVNLRIVKKDCICSSRTQVLYKAHVLYFHSHAFFSLEIAKKCFFVLYFLKNVLYFCKLFKWVEFLFQVFIYSTKIGEL